MNQIEVQRESKSPEFKPFEFQRWPVYREAVEFGISAHKLCGEFPRDGAKSISDQLRRAGQSISFNIAEGSSRFGAKEKVNFLRIARGSVFECVAILELVRGIEWIEKPRFDEFVQKLSLMGRMLSGFINHVGGKGEKSAIDQGLILKD
jgi:four helix bundle protein